MGTAARLCGIRAGVSQRISKLGLRLATPKGFASKPPRYTIAIEETHRYIINMKCIRLSVSLLIVASIYAIGQSPAPSQLSESSELFETIVRMDAKLFDAFNAHNLDAMMAMFADDLEFYQDNDGVSNYQQSKNDFTKMLASVPDIRRELVKNSLDRSRSAFTAFATRRTPKRNADHSSSCMSGAKPATRGKFHASSVTVTSRSSKKFNQRAGRFLRRSF